MTIQNTTFSFVGTDEFTGQQYAFNLEFFEFHADWEGNGPAVEAVLVTPNGSLNLVEWVEDGKVCRASPDSNIMVNVSDEAASAFAFDLAGLTPSDVFVPDALFDALDEKLAAAGGAQ